MSKTVTFPSRRALFASAPAAVAASILPATAAPSASDALSPAFAAALARYRAADQAFLESLKDDDISDDAAHAIDLKRIEASITFVQTPAVNAADARALLEIALPRILDNADYDPDEATPEALDITVESPRGLSHPGAPRTVREPLDSHGSRCPAVAMAYWPMREEFRIRSAEPIEPVSRTLGLMNHPLEFAARPSNDIDIDPPQGRTQLRRIEVTVVGDPATDGRVVHRGQLSQGSVIAMMQRPSSNGSTDARQRLRTGSR